MKMHCALAVADVLQPVPPFRHVRSSYSPEVARADFDRIPGVRESFVREADIGKNRAWEEADAVPLELD
jgi:hypothetical protein